jgi:hypothetical protein
MKIILTSVHKLSKVLSSISSVALVSIMVLTVADVVLRIFRDPSRARTRSWSSGPL